MDKVLYLYDNINVNMKKVEGQINPMKLSSIQKNKALTYKAMLERYQEIYYTGDDSAYDAELNRLKVILDQMTECLNKSLYYGIEC